MVYKKRLSIGVSACMYGANVRYNAKGWPMIDRLGREKGNFSWSPVCPEVMSGLGIPRNPISLQGGNGFEILEGKGRVSQKGVGDITKILIEGSKACFETLKKAKIDAYIFMEGSPSCGVFRTTLKDRRLGKPPGIFGAMLLNEGIFLIPAQDLQSPIKWWDWRRRLIAHSWLKEKEITTKKELYEVWHSLKFLCQELDEKWARNLGHELAEKVEEFTKEEIEKIKDDILNLFRRPSDVKKIKQWLWKNYSYLRKHKGIEIEGVNSPEDIRGITKIAQELISIEANMRKTEKGLFGSSPIIYKPNR